MKGQIYSDHSKRSIFLLNNFLQNYQITYYKVRHFIIQQLIYSYRRLCRTFRQWYESVPVVTRSLLTIYMFTATLLFFNVFPSLYMFHSWGMVLKLPVPQVWRLVTNFTVVDGFSLNLVFQLVWL
jgi:hypothetical protein